MTGSHGPGCGAPDSCSEDVSSFLACHVGFLSIFSPGQAPASMPGLQTSSPVAFTLSVAWLQDGTNFPMQTGKIPKAQKLAE